MKDEGDTGDESSPKKWWMMIMGQMLGEASTCVQDDELFSADVGEKDILHEFELFAYFPEQTEETQKRLRMIRYWFRLWYHGLNNQREIPDNRLSFVGVINKTLLINFFFGKTNRNSLRRSFLFKYDASEGRSSGFEQKPVSFSFPSGRRRRSAWRVLGTFPSDFLKWALTKQKTNELTGK